MDKRAKKKKIRGEILSFDSECFTTFYMHVL